MQIKNLELPLLNNKEKLSSSVENRETAFEQVLDYASKHLQEVSELEKETQNLTTNFILGKNDNIHELMISQQKTATMIQLTTQVTSNVISAYQEIMRLSV